jgi:transcriptional regulator with XRE-family HTH domain
VEKHLDARAIAFRVRALLGDRGLAGRKQAARRLRVAETTLREAVRDDMPRPSLELLAAIIRKYGVDPTWLLFGEYDPATHRVSLEAGSAFTAHELRGLAASRLRLDDIFSPILRLEGLPRLV